MGRATFSCVHTLLGHVRVRPPTCSIAEGTTCLASCQESGGLAAEGGAWERWATSEYSGLLFPGWIWFVPSSCLVFRRPRIATCPLLSWMVSPPSGHAPSTDSSGGVAYTAYIKPYFPSNEEPHECARLGATAKVGDRAKASQYDAFRNIRNIPVARLADRHRRRLRWQGQSTAATQWSRIVTQTSRKACCRRYVFHGPTEGTAATLGSSS